MLQRRKDVAFKREKALSQAFSQQVHFLHISLLPCFFLVLLGVQLISKLIQFFQTRTKDMEKP